MTTFPGAPRLRKGALVAVESLTKRASTIVFQYNPERLARSLTPRMTGEGSARADVQRLAGPPEETIDVTISIDATDQMERGGEIASLLGIYPQLAALELMIYPKTIAVIEGALLARAGGIELVPPEAPLTLFVWGIRRVLPVRLTRISVDEQAFDVDLNPLRAEVSLGMRVLSYTDLPFGSLGYGLFLAHHGGKEAMRATSLITNLGALGVDFHGVTDAAKAVSSITSLGSLGAALKPF